MSESGSPLDQALAELQARIEREFDEGYEFALASPFPEPEDAFKGNYTQREVMQQVRAKLRAYRDLRTGVRNLQAFNIGGGNFDIDFVIRGPELDKLAQFAEQLRDKSRELGGIIDADAGEESLGATIEFHPQRAGRVCADAVLELLPGNRERLFANGAIDLRLAPALSHLGEV